MTRIRLECVQGVEIILPVDFTCSSKFGEDGEVKEGAPVERDAFDPG